MKNKLVELLIEALTSETSTTPMTQIEYPFVVGEKYFFRTVTYFATGRVKRITGTFLELEDAAWVADTGRFRDAIMKGTLSEVEPVEVPMFVNMQSITDAFVWSHELPREQK